MAVEEVNTFYQRNVSYVVIVRKYRGDADGIALDGSSPTIEVQAKDHKVFREANKRAIQQGLIKIVPEPSTDWETNNAVSDEDIQGLLTNYPKLKSSLESIDSLPILYKIREAALEKGVTKKTQSLITSRIDALEPDDDEELREAIEARREVRV